MLALSSEVLSPLNSQQKVRVKPLCPKKGDRRSSWETEPVPGKCLKVPALGDSPNRAEGTKLSQHIPPTDLKLFIKVLIRHSVSKKLFV